MQVKVISVCIALSLVALTSAAPARRSTLSEASETFPSVQSKYLAHKDGLLPEGLDLDDLPALGGEPDLDDLDLDDDKLDDLPGLDDDKLDDLPSLDDDELDDLSDLDGDKLDDLSDLGDNADLGDKANLDDITDKVKSEDGGVLGGVPVISSVLGDHADLPGLGALSALG